MITIENIPTEILSQIAEYLIGKEVLAFEGVSRLFRSICEQPIIWKRKIAIEFSGEINLGVDNPSINYKRMYLEYCFYAYFSICLMEGNFEEIERYQIIGRNTYCKTTDIEYICIFNTNLENSKKQTYKALKQKMTPTVNKVIALKSYAGDNKTIHPENETFVPYMNDKEVNELLSENSQVDWNTILTKTMFEEGPIAHRLIIDEAYYKMNFQIHGKRIRRNLEFVYAFVSVNFCLNHYEINPDGSSVLNESKLNYIDFFENVYEIESWMKKGNLVEASDIICSTNGMYKISRFGIGGEYNSFSSYSKLTDDLMKTLRLGKIYKLGWGSYEGANDYFEIISIPVKEDSSFNFRNLPKEFEDDL